MNEAPIELILSGASLAITIYFWLVQARRERADLRVYQTGGLRAMLRRHPEHKDKKRLCVQQNSSLGVLIANNSSRQNTIIFFECWLQLPNGNHICGDWGIIGDDSPPWNIAPDSTIPMGMACFFDVPEDFVLPDHYALRVAFLTASGRRFWHTFGMQSPKSLSRCETSTRAAA